MSSSHEQVSELDQLIQKLSGITDHTQFAHNVNSNPQIMFDTFQLFLQSHSHLRERTNDLEAAKQRVKELEREFAPSSKDTSLMILSRLADILQPAQSKSNLLKDGELFSGRKEDYYSQRRIETCSYILTNEYYKQRPYTFIC